jgi:hypothetical protein
MSVSLRRLPKASIRGKEFIEGNRKRNHKRLMDLGAKGQHNFQQQEFIERNIKWKHKNMSGIVKDQVAKRGEDNISLQTILQRKD